jgi:hypothetical protein
LRSFRPGSGALFLFSFGLFYAPFCALTFNAAKLANGTKYFPATTNRRDPTIFQRQIFHWDWLKLIFGRTDAELLAHPLLFGMRTSNKQWNLKTLKITKT